MQRYLIDRIDDERLHVIVVWEPVLRGDTRESAMASASFLGGARVSHLWSPSRFGGTAFREKLGFQKSPAWDVFLLFEPGSLWGETPPVPVLQQYGTPDLPTSEPFHAPSLAKVIHMLLSSRDQHLRVPQSPPQKSWRRQSPPTNPLKRSPRLGLTIEPEPEGELLALLANKFDDTSPLERVTS